MEHKSQMVSESQGKAIEDTNKEAIRVEQKHVEEEIQIRDEESNKVIMTGFVQATTTTTITTKQQHEDHANIQIRDEDEVAQQQQQQQKQINEHKPIEVNPTLIEESKKEITQQQQPTTVTATSSSSISHEAEMKIREELRRELLSNSNSTTNTHEAENLTLKSILLSHLDTRANKVNHFLPSILTIYSN